MAALRRQVIRSALRATAKLFRRSGIEAGGGGRRWHGASVVTSPLQSTLAARGVSQARASGAYLNSPHANSAVEAHVSGLVGKGWHARSKHPDTAIARVLNERFEAMIAALLPLLARSLVRDGEAFVRITVTAGGAIRLKPIPSEQVDPTLTRDLGAGGRIVAGIEFNADDEVVAYHVLPEAPGTPFAVYGTAVRVPAADMLHVFDRLFAGQVRGLSWLAPVLLKLRDREEASDAMLMQLKTAALITGFISDPDGTFAGFEGQAKGGEMNVALEPGAMRILPGAATVTFSQPGTGLQQAVDFLRAQDREIAAGVGLTFEALTGDLSTTNYSSARVGLLAYRRRAEMQQRALIEGQFLRPLWRRWIELQGLAGDIEAFGPELDNYMAVSFVAPGWAWVDPRNEVDAAIAAIDAGLKSRAEVVAGRGRDIEELDEEIARDTARATQGNAL